jgi:hypothetical protein
MRTLLPLWLLVGSFQAAQAHGEYQFIYRRASRKHAATEARSRTGRSVSTVGTTLTGSSLKSPRPDADRASEGRPIRLARTQGTRRTAMAAQPRSQRRLLGKTTRPGRQPDGHSRWRRFSAHRRQPCARPRHAWVAQRLSQRRDPPPA